MPVPPVRKAVAVSQVSLVRLVPKVFKVSRVRLVSAVRRVQLACPFGASQV